MKKDMSAFGAVCIHQHLARSCYECELELEIGKLQSTLTFAKGAVEDMIHSGELLQEPLMQELLDRINAALK